MVVVPPKAAARVPVSNVSEANVPPNGSSMWVWASTPPGTTYLPVASTTLVRGGGEVGAERRVAGRQQRDDALAVDEHVEGLRADGPDDQPAADERGHGCTRSP